MFLSKMRNEIESSGCQRATSSRRPFPSSEQLVAQPIPPNKSDSMFTRGCVRAVLMPTIRLPSQPSVFPPNHPSSLPTIRLPSQPSVFPPNHPSSLPKQTTLLFADRSTAPPERGHSTTSTGFGPLTDASAGSDSCPPPAAFESNQEGEAATPGSAIRIRHRFVFRFIFRVICRRPDISATYSITFSRQFFGRAQ
ncbi:hypothetical protein BLNAU_22810 [Blattamonas nauphoetae]|uniref:Uncharacterized protein n=1 Tax=Blattamonas nauphoetae TaxID=2049346 RepID=A0ABQ9WSH3_9EUKA|nr:hypothetical protein BLNAU_22810 [Blattamonas nauphoetae]